ncbi:hypothetical protein ABPG77_002033 [Micractinium sp. CCAP 211/92]
MAHVDAAAAAAHQRGNRIAEVIVFFALVVLAFAIAILIILTDYVVGTGASPGEPLSTRAGYGFAVCIISFLTSIIMLFALCRPPVAIGGMAAFSTIWWLAYAITVSVYNNAVPNGTPEGHYRSTVIGLSWACFACELAIFALAAHLYRVAWQPEELGSGPVSEYGRYAEFKARAEAQAEGGAGSGAV